MIQIVVTIVLVWTAIVKMQCSRRRKSVESGKLVSPLYYLLQGLTTCSSIAHCLCPTAMTPDCPDMTKDTKQFALPDDPEVCIERLTSN